MTTPQKILIIEDDLFLGGVLKQKIAKAGYEVVLVTDGLKGLEEIKKMKPNLILLDIILPTMNGYEILEEKYKNPDIKDIPVIIVSNSGQPVEISRVLSLGVKDYLVKAQFDPEEVLAKVKSQLRSAEESSDSSQSAASEIGNKKIMWVEDDATLIDIIKRKVTIGGFNFVHAGTGEDALEMIEREMPDIVILDIILPGINGIEVLEKIKSMPKVAHIPVIMLSNLNQKSDMDKASKLGAVYFLTKATLSLNDIIEEIRDVLATTRVNNTSNILN